MAIEKPSDKVVEKLVRIKGDAHQELETLADKHHRSMKLFTEQMITYFKKFKIDPADLKDENVSVSLRSLRNDLIAFIKTQEKDKLIPMLEEMRHVSRQVEQTTGLVHTEVSHKQDFNTLTNRLYSLQKEVIGYTSPDGKQLSSLRQEIHKLLDELYGVEKGKEIKPSLRSEMKAILLELQGKSVIPEKLSIPSIRAELKTNRVELTTHSAAMSESLNAIKREISSSTALRKKAQQLFSDYLKELDGKSPFDSSKPITHKYQELFNNL